jgi:hypothetical protein
VDSTTAAMTTTVTFGVLLFRVVLAPGTEDCTATVLAYSEAAPIGETGCLFVACGIKILNLSGAAALC